MLPLARLLEKISLGGGVIAAILILPLMLAISWEVFSRYVLGSPTIWAYELGYMGLGAHFILGGAYTLKAGAHIRIDILYARFRPKWQALLDLVLYLGLLLPFTLWLTWGLWDFFQDAWRFGERSGQSAWNPVVWPFRLVLVTGFTLLAVQIVAECLKCLAVLTGRARSLAEIG
jgi:TRAP-type mannitol/chloroaromatic compound transport system permease small subunit